MLVTYSVLFLVNCCLFFDEFCSPLWYTSCSIFLLKSKKAEPAPLRLCLSLFLFILPLFFYFSLINDLTAKNCHIHFRGLDLIRVDLIDILLENYEVRIFSHFDGSVLVFCIGSVSCVFCKKLHRFVYGYFFGMGSSLPVADR